MKPWTSKPCRYCRCADWHHDYIFFPAAFVSGCAGCDGCCGYEANESADDMICDPEFQERVIEQAEDRRQRFIAAHPEAIEAMLQWVEERGLTEELQRRIAELEAG
jgi:hypothetical protein